MQLGLSLFQPVDTWAMGLAAGLHDDLEVAPRLGCVRKPHATVARIARGVLVQTHLPADSNLVYVRPSQVP